MVGLAGCAGIGLGLPIGAPAPYTETGAALDGDDLRAAHLAELEANGAYRSSFAFVIAGDQRSARVNRSVVVDRGANESFAHMSVAAEAIEGDGLTVATYSTGNTTYRRFVADVGQQTVTRYDAAQAPYADRPLAVEPVEPEEAAHADLIEPIVEDVNWSQHGVERYDGGWVTRYEAVGAENFSRLRGAAVDAGRVATDRGSLADYRGLEVRAVNATLLVGPDGVVRRFDIHVSGELRGQPIDLTLAGSTGELGTAAVEAPGWLDEAKERTTSGLG